MDNNDLPIIVLAPFCNPTNCHVLCILTNVFLSEHTGRSLLPKYINKPWHRSFRDALTK